MEELAKQRLAEYNELISRIDKMAVADALDELKLRAENLADSLTDLVYNE